MHLFCQIFVTTLFTSLALLAAAPPLSNFDVQNTLKKILREHITFSQINTLLVQRAFSNYIEELDPLKIYFLEDEISQWVNPSDELLQRVITQYNNGDLSEFIKIHQSFSLAIERQKRLENSLVLVDSEKSLKPSSHILQTSWAQTEIDLQQRIQELHLWQVSLHQSLDPQLSAPPLLEKILAKKRRKESSMLGNSEIQQQYEAFALILKSFALAMDPHTCYFTPAEALQCIVQIQRKLSGIGVHLRDDLDGFTVVKILEAAPEKNLALLKTNDKIIAINGTSVVGMDFIDVVNLIRGPKGSSVSVTVIRQSPNPPLNYEKTELLLQRAEIALPEGRVEVDQKQIEGGIIGTIKLHSFYRDDKTSSMDDVSAAIQQMQTANKVHGIILDLRNNGGGLLPEAIAVSGLFLKQGIVASIKDNQGKIHHLRSLKETPLWAGPLIVLINRLSASASELTAQALQDYGRALIVGDTSSFGKGTFQRLTLDLHSLQPNPKANPKGELAITGGCYYSPSGKSPQLCGVLSDIEVPGLFSKEDIGEKFTKYPLPITTIEEHFEDTFSDLSPFSRLQAKWLYNKAPQERLFHLQKLIPTLQEHSKKRIQNSPEYQEFLNTLEEKKQLPDPTESYAKKDLQLEETYLIMEELLSRTKSPSLDGG